MEMYFEVLAAKGYDDDQQNEPNWQYIEQFDSAKAALEALDEVSDYPIVALNLVRIDEQDKRYVTHLAPLASFGD